MTTREERNAYAREWRKTAKAKKYNLEYFRKFRSEKRELERTRHRKAHAIYLLGGHCMDCGWDLTIHPEQADFDHVRGTKVCDLARLWRGSKKKFATELAKCDLVCANCHRTRTVQRHKANGGLWVIGDYLED